MLHEVSSVGVHEQRAVPNLSQACTERGPLFVQALPTRPASGPPMFLCATLCAQGGARLISAKFFYLMSLCIVSYHRPHRLSCCCCESIRGNEGHPEKKDEVVLCAPMVCLDSVWHQMVPPLSQGSTLPPHRLPRPPLPQHTSLQMRTSPAACRPALVRSEWEAQWLCSNCAVNNVSYPL